MTDQPAAGSSDRAQDKGTGKTDFQFSTRHLLALTALVACASAYGMYQYPGKPLRVAGTIVVVMASLLVVAAACMLPARYGRWPRAVAVILCGLAAMAFGLWASRNL